MKKLFLLLITVCFTSVSAFGQAIPKQIDYQGVLKTSGGVIVQDGNYQLTFKIYNDPTGGSALWTEVQTVTVTNGIFSAHLGSVTPITTVPFNRIHFLGITVESDPELSPRTMLTPSPYSYMAMDVTDNTVVKSLNSLKDNVNLVAGSNIAITPSGNDITISATGGGGGTIGGSGTTNYIPVFTNSTSIGNSLISEISGKIGIDDNNPNYMLTINSGAAAGLGLKIHRTGGTNLLLKNDGSPTDEKGWALNVYDTKFQIRTIADNDITTLLNVATFERNGYVGLGTDAPITNFQLVHDQYIPEGGFTLQQTSNSNRWQFYVSQSSSYLRLFYNDGSMGQFNNTNGNYEPVSDVRLKKNIQPINSMLGVLKKLQPVTYQLINNTEADGISYGLVAQDLEKVLPELVSINKSDDGDGLSDLRTVSYTELIPILIKALQEQLIIIEDLTTRISHLEVK
jgi:hypothetical protein